MPADASPAATGRSEPSGPADTARREAGGPVPPPADAARRDTGVTVPPPRSAPAVEAAPAAEADPAPAPEADAALAGEDAHPLVEPGDGLTERDRQILAFEQQWWKHAGAKEQSIRDTFGLSATRYYQLLNALLDHPAALAAEPVLVGRLRRLRSARTRNRRR